MVETKKVEKAEQTKIQTNEPHENVVTLKVTNPSTCRMENVTN